VDTWSDSDLRSFLVQQGVVSPSGTREQLVVLAKEKYRQISGQTKHTPLDILVEKPRLVYDSFIDSLDTAKDYTYSAWSDLDIRGFLQEKGQQVADSISHSELVQKVHSYYQDQAEHAWDSWSDSTIQNWLISHGIINKSYVPSSASELRDLISKHYYSAHDTTFKNWSTKELENWAIEKGLVKSKGQKKKEELLSLVSDNYYSLRDAAYTSWSDESLKSWLVQKGIIKSNVQKKREEYLDLFKQNYYTAQDKVWDTFSDSKIRDFLVSNGVIEGTVAEKLARGDLEKYMEKNYIKLSTSLDEMKEWLMSHALGVEDNTSVEEIKQKFLYHYGTEFSRLHEYLTWSDARIRGWLRENKLGFEQNASRDELLQAIRENYVVVQNSLPVFFRNSNGFLHDLVTFSQNSVSNIVTKLKHVFLPFGGSASYQTNADVLSAKAKIAQNSLGSAASRASASASKIVRQEL